MKEKGKAGQRKETEGRQGGGQMEGFSKKMKCIVLGGLSQATPLPTHPASPSSPPPLLHTHLRFNAAA